MSIVWLISAAVISSVVSFAIYSILTNNPDGDNPYANKIHWIDILLPMLIPSVFAVYIYVRKHDSDV